MAAENYVCAMEDGNLVVRQSPRPRSRGRCCKWLAALSFAALFGATVMLTLLYFGVIPPPQRPAEQGDLMQEKSAAEHYINPIPQQLKLQARESRKPAAHLIADLSQKKKLIWVADKGHAFMENGMELEDNKLVIPTRGLYFVYSQVVFYGRSCHGKQSLYLSHKVNKHSEAYPVDMPLLSATKSACEGDTHGQPWYETIYQGGVFTLEEGDVLSTATTEITHLDPKSAQNYFGAIAM